MSQVKCERCGCISDLFQYIDFKEEKWVEHTKDNGIGADPRFTIERINLNESRGLCEGCAVEVNKRNYDRAHSA